ncbi:uncharacterized protein [Palaemon carinicauda]|uniref:uncharacterized protein n=1 Tax=Palaemon carinicauda TaxID=392227 RepID=UPI0035B587FA
MSSITDFNVEQYDRCLSDTHSALSMVLRLEKTCNMRPPKIQEEENLDLDRIIKPIFKKKGSPDNPDNYRGITLQSCGAKLFTACVNKRLTDYIDSTGQLGEEQAGFREEYSVRQGENLSPLLYALYLNDFESSLSRGYNGMDMCLKEINEKFSSIDIERFLLIYALLYADDTIVMDESPKELQNALNKVKEYFDIWKLQINVSKTKIVEFSRGKYRNVTNSKYGEESIEIVEDYVYLGTTFNYNGKMDKAIKKQVI